MKIITAADDNYFKFLRYLEDNIFKFYKEYPLIYNLGINETSIHSLKSKVKKLKINTDYACFDSRGNIKATHKPLCILDFLNSYECLDCLYIDADILFSKYVSRKFFKNTDFAVAHRHYKEQSNDHFLNGFINSGVIYIRNNNKAKKIIIDWYNECTKENMTDQLALSNLIMNKTNIYQKSDFIYLKEDEIQLKILNPSIYNDTSLCTGNILHFKNAGRSDRIFKRYKTYSKLIKVNKYLCKIYMIFKNLKLYNKIKID